MLRTYRRAAGGKRKAQVNAKMSLMHQFMPNVGAGIDQSKLGPPRKPKSTINRLRFNENSMKARVRTLGSLNFVDRINGDSKIVAPYNCGSALLSKLLNGPLKAPLKGP